MHYIYREGNFTKPSRDITYIVNWILDNICPPILRDCYPLMYPIYRCVYGKYTRDLLKYKDNYPQITDKEYSRYYEMASKTALSSRPTDLNKKSLEFVLRNVNGRILDVGCGRGFLCGQMAELGFNVDGIDIVRSGMFKENDNCHFILGNIEAGTDIPDKSYDTVVCTHVLEHVRNPQKVIEEIFRMAKERVIIVLPCQREYRYVADLHVRFFPYIYDVENLIGKRDAKIQKIGGDWCVIIDI